jgi:hypothetical protein
MGAPLPRTIVPVDAGITTDRQQDNFCRTYGIV